MHDMHMNLVQSKDWRDATDHIKTRRNWKSSRNKDNEGAIKKKGEKLYFKDIFFTKT
jgi:hypothetical protein